MNNKKSNGIGVLDLAWKIGAAAALGAAAFGAYKLWSWSKDSYATALWVPFGRKGIRVTKGPEKNTYLVETGYTWQDDLPEETPEEESEMEVELRELEPEEGLEG